MNVEAFRLEVRAKLDQALAGVDSVEDYLRAVLLQAPELTGVQGSYSISTALEGRPVAVATSDRDAWDADQVEFDIEAGPCVEALAGGGATSVPDLQVEDRWSSWTTIARVLGFESAAGAAAEIPSDGHRVALNAYSREPAAFEGEGLQRCQVLVAEIAGALPAALRVCDQASTIAELQAALVSRSTIDQALGVVMGQNRCSRDDAFAIVRRASQNSNVKLRDVAAAIIERCTGQPVPPPHTFESPSSLPRRPAALSRTGER